MSKLVLAVIISIIMIFMMVTETECEDVEVINMLPSIKELADEEIARIQEEKITAELEKNRNTERKKRRVEDVVSRGSDRGLFTVTAYDLSYASCGKEPSHPAYGITANGTSLKGHTLESARAIAVDPKVIKLGSVVHIEFFEPYTHLTGNYTAVDTGGAIKGNKIDIFFGGQNVSKEVSNFGRREVRVTY